MAYQVPFDSISMSSSEWYYVGKFGQVGPLPEDHALDLASCGVISRETFVWCEGMTDWQRAAEVDLFKPKMPTPPPPPTPFGPPVTGPYHLAGRESAYLIPDKPRSPLSRVAGGVLNILLPGVGRMYLGFPVAGILQLVVTMASCGFGYVWPFIDGILMLTGTVSEDGLGRRLES
ncbi:MAG: GYF domain-containing protein [Fimbriimonadales bacterium]